VNDPNRPPRCHVGQARLLLVGHRVLVGGDFFARSGDPGPPGVVSRNCLRFESIVKRLERRLGRVVAIALVAVVAFAAVTAFGYLLKHQLVDLSTQMTNVLRVMRRKVSALRGPKGGGLLDCPKVSTGGPTAGRARGGRSRSPSVKLIPAEATTTERIEAVLTPVLAPLAKVLIVLVLVIFLLGKHEDLRDRFIRLSAEGN